MLSPRAAGYDALPYAPRKRNARALQQRLQATHQGVLGFAEFLDSVVRAFASDAAFLDAAEGRNLRGRDALVHTDDAVFECLGNAPAAPEVTGEEVGSEPERRVVCHAHGFFLGL